MEPMSVHLPVISARPGSFVKITRPARGEFGQRLLDHMALERSVQRLDALAQQGLPGVYIEILARPALRPPRAKPPSEAPGTTD